MDKLDVDHKFNYDFEQDSDVTDTLNNAKLAESMVNTRHSGYGGYNNYGYGGYGGYGGYSGYGNEEKDWWTGLIKDNGKEGMISTSAKANRWNYYGGHTWKNYDELAS